MWATSTPRSSSSFSGSGMLIRYAARALGATGY
jgi:hypothetical protein